jgi:hypothetical protein
MCDTMYAGAAVAGGPWFAKNSDRSPDEPQALCLVPAAPAGSPLVIGGRDFPAGAARHACALSRPSWMEGGEMGLNDAGLAIGNEAVFPRHAPAKDGVLGMDLLRAALVACSSADEAADYICSFVEGHAQGGNGAYHGKLYYDNSYLAADREGAWIIETAGHRWARRRVEGLASISNCYSLERDWDLVDAATAAALDRPGRGKRSWRAFVQNPLYLAFTHGGTRRRLTREAMERGLAARMARTAGGAAPPVSSGPASGADLSFMLPVLRQHGGYVPGRRGSLASPCVHEGGFPVNNATTASMAVSWPSGTEASILWFTGSSLPCVSLFKPLVLARGEFIPLWTDYDHAEGSQSACAYWEKRREWSRSGKNPSLSLDPGFVALRDEAQEKLAGIAYRAASALEDAEGKPSRVDLATMQGEVNSIVAGWEGEAAGFRTAARG